MKNNSVSILKYLGHFILTVLVIIFILILPSFIEKSDRNRQQSELVSMLRETLIETRIETPEDIDKINRVQEMIITEDSIFTTIKNEYNIYMVSIAVMIFFIGAIIVSMIYPTCRDVTKI